MTNSRSGTLYSPRLLALAVELADYPFDRAAPFIGEARSRSCGSSVALSAAPKNLGLRVSACAVGQAAAAIFARHYSGKNCGDIASALAAIELWLGDNEAKLPDWPDIAILEPARAFPGRHGAIILPWKAALDALSKGGEGR